MSPTFPVHGQYGWEGLLKDYIDAAGGGEAVATIADVAPVSPTDGQLWVDTSDITSSSGPNTLDVEISATAPSSPVDGGTMWIDTSDSTEFSQDAAQISVTPVGNIDSTDVQDALAELDTKKVAVTQLGAIDGVATLGPDGILVASQRPAGSGGSTPTALSTTFTASGTITATDVQDAIEQLDEHKIATSAAGVPNGVATLGPDGILLAAQRPPSTGGSGGSASISEFVATQQLFDPAKTATWLVDTASFFGSQHTPANFYWHNAAATSGPNYLTSTTSNLTGQSLQAAPLYVPISSTAGGEAQVTLRANFALSGGATANPNLSASITPTNASGATTGSGAGAVLTAGQWTTLQCAVPAGTTFLNIIVHGIRATDTVGEVSLTVDVQPVLQGTIETDIGTALGDLSARPFAASEITYNADAGKGILIPGPGRFYYQGRPGTAQFMSLLDVPESSTGSNVGATAELIVLPVVGTSLTMTIEPALQAYQVPTNLGQIPAGYGAYWRFTWMGAALGWFCDEAVYIPPQRAALPTPSSGTLYIGGWVMRGSTGPASTAVQDIVTYVPSVVLQGIAAAGIQLSIADNMAFTTMGAASPNDIKLDDYSIGGNAWGLYLPDDGYITFTTVPYETHVPVHETCHGMDFGYSAYLAAHPPSGGWTLSPSAPMHDHPDFQALYNACVADSTIDHSQYAYTNINEFWAEVFSLHWTNNLTPNNGNTTLANVIGSSRLTQFSNFLTKIGLS